MLLACADEVIGRDRLASNTPPGHAHIAKSGEALDARRSFSTQPIRTFQVRCEQGTCYA
jgi:hypothetical protein